MTQRPILWFLILTGAGGPVACSSKAPEQALQIISNVAQGTTYTIKWWGAPDVEPAAFAGAVQNELVRIDELLSNFRDDSAIEHFNAARTVEPQSLPEEIVGLLQIAATVHEESAGCFDPTVRPLARLWGFDTDTPGVPDAAAVAAVLEHVGFGKLEIVDAQRVRKTDPDVEVDLSGIGQGYTVAQLSRIATEHGIENYLVEIGGELAARGHKADAEPWRVGIEHPSAASRDIQRVLVLPAERLTAVMTSGTYRHFFEDDGQTYSHILDPLTGRPVRHDLLSVTVLHSDPTLAGAWSTALLCLGPDRARAAADREGLVALLLIRAGESIEEWRSASLIENWPGVIE